MKGRPKKNHLEPVWREDRKRFQVVVPASWEGRRITKFFTDEYSALEWIAGRTKERSRRIPLDIEAPPEDPTTTISHLVTTYNKKRLAGKAGARTANYHLAMFTERFGGLPIDSLAPVPLDEWLQSIPHTERTRWGVFSTCRTFCRWAVRFRHSRTNPFDSIDAPNKGRAAKAIMRPEQMAAALDPRAMIGVYGRPVPTYLLAWIALGGFAGIRTVEIQRMTWDQVNFESGEIHVPEHAIKRSRKGVRERYVKMLPAFIANCPRGLTGKIIPCTRKAFHRNASELATLIFGGKRKQKKGHRELIPWPHNALRHSFASYHLAMWENAGVTAFQMGHTSTDMVHQNYARAVTKDDAVKWWDITP